jgi:hypothetical protein
MKPYHSADVSYKMDVSGLVHRKNLINKGKKNKNRNPCKEKRSKLEKKKKKKKKKKNDKKRENDVIIKINT